MGGAGGAGGGQQGGSSAAARAARAAWLPAARWGLGGWQLHHRQPQRVNGKGTMMGVCLSGWEGPGGDLGRQGALLHALLQGGAGQGRKVLRSAHRRMHVRTGTALGGVFASGPWHLHRPHGLRRPRARRPRPLSVHELLRQKQLMTPQAKGRKRRVPVRPEPVSPVRPPVGAA